MSVPPLDRTSKVSVWMESLSDTLTRGWAVQYAQNVWGSQVMRWWIGGFVEYGFDT